ncbi:MAG: SpoIIE family protein phosphatase, partial [Lachnospiraceae bacterium]|nr:SpoIIE family protein phosphatase [Lachnospiraceae bacterium]
REIANAMQAVIDPDAAIYGAAVFTLSGPVLLSNGMEAEAAKDTTWMNVWAEAYRVNLAREDITDEIVYAKLVEDVVTGEICFVVAKPIFYDGKHWGVICFFIDPQYFEDLVSKDSLDEQDVCFITSTSSIDAFISSESEGTFRFVANIPDRDEYVLNNTEKEASEALLKAFKQSSRGRVKATLNTPVAGSREMTFYYSSIDTPQEMLVVGRPSAVTQAHAEEVLDTIRDIVEDSDEMAERYLTTTIVIFILGIAGAYIITSRLSRKYADNLTTPIRTLTKKVEAMDGDTLEFTWEKMREKDDEIEILADSFGSMTERIRDDISHIKQMKTERERIEAELTLAASIQMAMLPPLNERFTDGEGFTLYATMRPAREVGGDFYDFFMMDEDHLAFLIADVSDKGIGAAIFMAISKSIIRMRSMSGGSPGEILKDVDAMLSEGNEAAMFVTVFMAVLEISTGRVTACNGGHDYPMVCIAEAGKRRSFRMLEEEHGRPLAFLPGNVFPELNWQLSPGDRIYLYTDGVNEAQGKGDYSEQFGTDRMIEVLNKCVDEDDRSLCESMSGSVDAFLRDEPQFDDMTMLSLTYRGNRNTVKSADSQGS